MIAKMTTAPNIKELKFIVAGVTGVAEGQKLKKIMTIIYKQAIALTSMPVNPGT